MDNPNQPTNPPASPTAPSPVAPSSVVPPIVEQPVAPPPPAVSARSKFSFPNPKDILGKVTKKQIIMLSTFFIVFVILLVLGIIFRDKIQNIVPLPSPTPTATPVVATPTPSRYATDSGVLKIEADINTLDGELSGVDLEESNIKPRPLDFDINFK